MPAKTVATRANKAAKRSASKATPFTPSVARAKAPFAAKVHANARRKVHTHKLVTRIGMAAAAMAKGLQSQGATIDDAVYMFEVIAFWTNTLDARRGRLNPTLGGKVG
jgi:hypothetical protein